MRRFLVGAILLLMLCGLASAGQEITKDMSYSDQYILILKSTKDYNEALSFAKKASEKLRLKFDDGKGAPEGDSPPRRYSGESISLEDSKNYPELVPGYTIVIAGIYGSEESSRIALNNVRKFYEDAYIKKVNMWMSCIH